MRGIDITGKKFGKLLAVERTELRSRGAVLWSCLCDCGKTHLAAAGRLKAGEVKSCGCTKEKGETHCRWKGGIRHYKKVIVICPDCGIKREVLEKNQKKHNHTKRCRKCSMKHVASGISGKEHYRWKGGVTPTNEKIRKSAEYKEWRRTVIERDNYTCVCCEKKGGDLNIHHIISFCEDENRRVDVNNGVTLCVTCHKGFHDFYGYKNDKHQFSEFLENVHC